MHTAVPEDMLEQLQLWIGDSEAANWNEYITEHVAKGVLQAFTAAQWQRLDALLLDQPEYWQQRCAVSLGELRGPQAIALLKRLLVQSPYLDVRIMAIYELDWAEVAIERRYALPVREVMARLPEDQVEPELHSLLAKAEAASC
ncbi:MAG: HEAT repeat domain-containing protein [Pseudomonas piscis]|uniref:HEAT repeat domain-containing protein n=1 Tax=Pseudomonas piscis TaxID=2614538 RepID=UPI003D2C637C